MYNEIRIRWGTGGQTFPPTGPIWIGRAPECEITLTNPNVSRLHAKLEPTPTSWVFHDLDSAQGSWCNGQRVTQMTIDRPCEVLVGQPGKGDLIDLIVAGEDLTVVPEASPRSSVVAESPPPVPTVAPPTNPPVPVATGPGDPDGRSDGPPARSGWSPSRNVLIGTAVLVTIAVVAIVVVATRSSGPDPASLAQSTVRITSSTGPPGSGVIIDAAKGLVLTSAAAVDPRAPGRAVLYGTPATSLGARPTALQVDVAPGRDRPATRRFEASVVATDGYLDLSVIKLTKTSSGRSVGPADLTGLRAIALGNSTVIARGGEAQITTYPSTGRAPIASVSDVTVSSVVSDPRLSTTRAGLQITTDAAFLGGLASDDDGAVVGVVTGRGVIRPLALAHALMAAAIAGRPYASPTLEAVGKESLQPPGGNRAASKPGFSFDCEDGKATAGAQKVGVQFEFGDFRAGSHQDLLVQVLDSSNKVLGKVDTNSSWPFAWPTAGCATATIGLEAPLTSGTYQVTFGLGPMYASVPSENFTITVP